MVRAGSNSFLINDFKQNNLVAIGWNLGDLTNKSGDEIYELFRKKYRNTRSAMQVIRFVYDIKIGDYVVSYYKENRSYLLGKVTSDYYHADKISKVDEANDNYWDIHDVEWLCEIPKESFKKSTQGTLGTQTTVFHINDDAKNDILNVSNVYLKTGINKIQTLTLSNQDPDCLTYNQTVDFLSNVLINERNCHFHYDRRRPVYFVKNTLILFKYEGKLIAEGIFIDEFRIPESVNGVNYSGYYLVDKDSIEIFKKPIGLNDIQRYVNEVISLNRDQIIDIKYLENINQMIKDFSGENPMVNQYDSSARIIRNYLDENNLGDLEQEDLKIVFEKFRRLFGPEVLEKLEAIDIINKIFLHDGDNTTLCYNLEFSKEFMRGGIGGGSAFKFSLFKANKNHKWTTGSTKNPKELTEQEAIEIGSKIRDAFVNGARHIEKLSLDSIEEFSNLEEDLVEIFSDCIVKPTASWVHKYFVLLFPEKFIDIHAAGMKIDFLQKFRIEPLDGYYANDGQFYMLAKKSGVKLYSLLDRRIIDLFFESDNQWKPIEEGKLVDIKENVEIEPFVSDLKRNMIYFGAPGTGKSYNLNQDKDKLLENYENNYERVTFHPDYSYANFVGTFKPYPDDKDIIYKYVPGPFMRILKKAIENPDKPYLLIIEEINRANVAAVFGDVFQLLDRNENYQSVYPIDTTEDMKLYLNQDKIILPQNLFIWATMNSADQGVFPMDTAFKRRWDFKYFSINNDDELIKDTFANLNNVVINWNTLRKAINDELLSYKINEDKCIGPFFAFNEYHNKEIPTDIFKDTFKSKIIMYLFEDAARSKRNDMFSGAKTKNYVTYSEICDKFDEIGIEIFADDIKNLFITDDGE